MTRGGSFGVLLLMAVVGLPGAFFTIALPAQMRDGGASLAEIGLIWVVWLPSAFKWVWAPWVERLAIPAPVRRRAIAAFAMLLALGFVPVAPLAGRMATGPLVGLAALCAALALSLQLLYAGWAMRMLDEPARARANGLAAAGMVLGGIIGGGVLPWASGLVGWWAAILCTSAAMAVSGLAGGLLRDGAITRPGQAVSVLKGGAILRDVPLVGCALVVAAASGGDMTLPARLVDAGIPAAQAGLLLGTVALLLMAPASVLSGWLISFAGIGMCVLGCAVLKAAVLLGLALTPMGAQAVVAVLSVADFVLAGAFTVLTWQFYMRHALPAAPVASFAVLTSLDALVRFAAAIGAGLFAGALGYVPLFGCAALMTLLAGGAVARLSASRGQARIRPETVADRGNLNCRDMTMTDA